MYKLQANYARVNGAWSNTSQASLQQCDTKWKQTTINKPSLAFAALTALLTMTWMAAKNVVRGSETPLSPQPKSQRDAHMRPDADRWLKAEETEMSTCYNKGTFDIVDLPPGAIELPS
eukprot:3921240-Rhodomonas_salina.1